MNEVVKQSGANALELAKLWFAIVLVIAGIGAFYAFSAEPAYVRWGSVVAGIVLGGIVLALSSYGREFRQFVLDSRVELRKIFWPSRDETLKVTGVVFLFVTIASAFFWIIDLILAWATRALTGQGG